MNRPRRFCLWGGSETRVRSSFSRGRSGSLAKQVVIACVRIVVLPVAHGLQACRGRKGDKFFRGRVERNNRPWTDYFGVPCEPPPRHPPNHTYPGTETVLTIKVREELLTGFERWRRILLRGKGNLADVNPRTGLGNAPHLSQARGNFLTRYDQEDVVANHDVGAGVGQWELVGQSLAHVNPSFSDQADLFFCREKSDSAMDAARLRHSQQSAVSAADVHEIVGGTKTHDLHDLLVNAASNFLLLASP